MCGTLARQPLCAQERFCAPESFPTKETFAFHLSLYLSYQSSVNLFSFSFVSMQFFFSCLLLPFHSISYSAFPFAFLYKVLLIDHCLECIFFLLPVFSSIHHSPSWIFQSPFYLLGGLWITPGIFRVKKTKALTGKVFVQGHRKLVPMRTDTQPHKDHVTDWSHTPPQM